MDDLELNIMGDPEKAFGESYNQKDDLLGVMLAGDMRALAESMRDLGERCNCSVKASFEYADGATLSISYEHAKGGAA